MMDSNQNQDVNIWFYLIPLLLPEWDSLRYWFYLLIFSVICKAEETPILPRGSCSQISSAMSVCKEEESCKVKHKLWLIIQAVTFKKQKSILTTDKNYRKTFPTTMSLLYSRLTCSLKLFDNSSLMFPV